VQRLESKGITSLLDIYRIYHQPSADMRGLTAAEIQVFYDTWARYGSDDMVPQNMVPVMNWIATMVGPRMVTLREIIVDYLTEAIGGRDTIREASLADVKRYIVWYDFERNSFFTSMVTGGRDPLRMEPPRAIGIIRVWPFQGASWPLMK